MHARDIMTKNVVTAGPSMSIRTAGKLLSKNGYSALPVVDGGGELVGIVTEADLIGNRFPVIEGAPGLVAADVPGRTVEDVMTTPVIGVSHDADVAVVAREMLVHRRRCIPIIDGSRPVGVITRRDIVKVLARSDEEIARDVRTHLKYLGAPGRWTVQVVDADVILTDEFSDSSDRSVAIALADAVPGVLGVSVRSGAEPVQTGGSSLDKE